MSDNPKFKTGDYVECRLSGQTYEGRVCEAGVYPPHKSDEYFVNFVKPIWIHRSEWHSMWVLERNLSLSISKKIQELL